MTELIIILLLILTNGFFSMSELAIVSSRRFKLEQKVARGVQGAKAALELSQNPSIFLSTNQIGITLVGISLGAFGGEAFAGKIEDFLIHLGMLPAMAYRLSLGAVVISITAFTLIFGELLPKRVGLLFPEKISVKIANPLVILSKVAYPFVWFLSSTNLFLLKLLKLDQEQPPVITEEEIRYLVKESASGGEIQAIEQDLVERIFDFGDAKVESLMTPREVITFLDISMTLKEVIQKVRKDKHSAYPLVKNNDLDQVIGLVLIKDLFTLERYEGNLKTIARVPLKLQSTTPAYHVLEIFKENKTHYALIEDGDGRIAGILTMDDVMESLIGEIVEFDKQTYTIVARNENSWLVDARYPIIEFLRYFQITHLIKDQLGYNTVAGLLKDLLGRTPELGEVIHIGEFEIEVVDKDKHIVDKVMVTRMH
ncbi:MAG TPA: hemolysin family protein [Saprospiraceae bacterium]|nr:hemolysin family protein [Saprospiraceae bacterium]